MQELFNLAVFVVALFGLAYLSEAMDATGLEPFQVIAICAAIAAASSMAAGAYRMRQGPPDELLEDEHGQWMFETRMLLIVPPALIAIFVALSFAFCLALAPRR